MNWYVEVLKKYAVFDGRARRREYWLFFLFNLIIACILVIIEGIFGIGSGEGPGVLMSLFPLAIAIPSLAVGVRRLHDTGRSGLWMLVVFVPIIGAIVFLVFIVEDSETGENKYGPNPKEPPAA